MRAEADHPDRRDRDQTEGAGERHPRTLAPARLSEHEEGQHEPGRQLHAHAGGERDRGPARALAHARAQQQRGGEREQHQGVVVRAAHREHEQHRVQAEEGERERARASEPPGGERRQPHGGEARDRRERLQRPQPAGEAERGHCVAGEREQRPVGRVLERPADEAEHGIGGRLGGEVRVRVEPVQGAHATEREIAEHVLGDQRRAEQQDHVGEHDSRCEQREGQRAGGHERDQVAGADDERERLEAALAEHFARPGERAREPMRPAAAVGRHVA